MSDDRPVTGEFWIVLAIVVMIAALAMSSSTLSSPVLVVGLVLLLAGIVMRIRAAQR